MSYRMSLFRTIDALSSCLDFVGIDDVMHGKRVGIMAVRVAELLGWDEDRRQTLLYAGFLHDCGVSTTDEHGNLVTELEWSNADNHCKRGEKYLNEVSLFAHMAPYIRYHHTRWEDLPKKQVSQDVAEMANIIFLVDRLDILRAAYGPAEAFDNREQFLSVIRKYSGRLFCPEMVEALDKCSHSEAFWFSLDPQMLEMHIREQSMLGSKLDINQDNLRSIATMFAHIIDAKSHFTADHSVRVAQLSRYIAEGLGIDQETCAGIEIAGYLHDLGKLRIPDAILEKPGPLTTVERPTMKRHAYDTYEILYRLFGDDTIALWASFHHETINGEGYPFQLSGAKLPFEARIIGVADIVQALVQNRPYRPSLPSAEVMTIVDGMFNAGRLDERVVNFFRDHLQECWQMAGGVD